MRCSTILLVAVFSIACANVNVFTWNLWLSGYESVPEMVISGKYDLVRTFFAGLQIDASLPKNEAQRRVQQWVAQQNSTIQQRYSNLTGLLNQTHQQFVEIVRSGFNTQLSPQAQNVVREIQRIENNKYLATRDIQRQIDQLLSGITYNIQSELRSFDQKATQIFVQRFGSPAIGNQPLLNLPENQNNNNNNPWNSNDSNKGGNPNDGWNDVGNNHQNSWDTVGTVTDDSKSGWDSIKTDVTTTKDCLNWNSIGNI